MVGRYQKMITRPIDKRQVIKLSVTMLNPSGKKYLSIVPCDMKDIKKGDVFFMLESSMELVVGKDNSFLHRAKTNGMPHKDTYLVQTEEIA